MWRKCFDLELQKLYDWVPFLTKATLCLCINFCHWFAWCSIKSPKHRDLQHSLGWLFLHLEPLFHDLLFLYFKSMLSHSGIISLYHTTSCPHGTYSPPLFVDFYKCEPSSANFFQSSSNGRCLQPGWDCNLKNFPLPEERADHWLEIGDSLCLGCLPLQQRSTWLDPPLGNGGEKRKKRKALVWTQSPGQWPKRWKIEKSTYFLSVCLYQSVFIWKLPLVLLTRLQAGPGRFYPVLLLPWPTK